MVDPTQLPTGPELGDALEPVRTADLQHDQRLSEVILSEADLADQDARGVTLDTSRLTDVDLSGSRLPDL